MVRQASLSFESPLVTRFLEAAEKLVDTLMHRLGKDDVAAHLNFLF